MLKCKALTAMMLGMGMLALPAARAQQKGGSSVTLTAEDRTEIQQLAAHYARALGTCAADEYAGLFATPDGYFASGTSGKVVGHKMLADLVLGQTHCINDTAIGGGPRIRDGSNGPASRPGNGPVLTIEVSSEGVTGRSVLRDHGHYEDVYVKTPDGWRFKSRTHLSTEQEKAQLTPQDYEEIRKLAGSSTEHFEDIYLTTPKGLRFKSAGLVIEPSPDGATGKAYLAKNGSHYDDVYVKSPAGWRFKSRLYVEGER